MEFYQKLQTLRKTSGMSQEDLATHLNVSRQAVSKWENGQGFPETDKIIQLSNLFGVSIDSLLKEDASEKESTVDDGGFYANREMVEGYLLEKRIGSFRIAVGVAIIIVSAIFPMMMQNSLSMVFTLLTAAVGIVFLIWQSFLPKRYEELEKRTLVMDGQYVKELKNRQMTRRTRNGLLIACGVLLLILAVVAMFVLQEVFYFSEDISVSFFPLVVAIAVSLFIIAGSELEAWNIIVNNKAHVEELDKGRRFGWISGSIMSLAVAIFLFFGFVYQAWGIVWVVFPIAGILSGVVTGIAHGVSK